MTVIKRYSAFCLATLLGGMTCVIPSTVWAKGGSGHSGSGHSGSSHAGNQSGSKSVSVGGYTRSNGTYVAPHTRSVPGSGAHSSSSSGYTGDSGYAEDSDSSSPLTKSDSESNITNSNLKSDLTTSNPEISITTDLQQSDAIIGKPKIKELSNDPYYYYMKIGYVQTAQKDYMSALASFEIALEERPSDSYATKAIANVKNYIQGGQGLQVNIKLIASAGILLHGSFISL